MVKVRNFWATLAADGRKATTSTGPKGEDGGMTINLNVRHKGESTPAVTIECNVDKWLTPNGKLTVEVWDNVTGELVLSRAFDRD